jgi:hypothetical protein
LDFDSAIMSSQEPPYDPYIPSGQTGTQQAGGAGGNARTQALQAVSSRVEKVSHSLGFTTDVFFTSYERLGAWRRQAGDAAAEVKRWSKQPNSAVMKKGIDTRSGQEALRRTDAHLFPCRFALSKPLACKS